MLLYYSLAVFLPLAIAQSSVPVPVAGASAAAPVQSSLPIPPELVGTWSTKSRSTVTGPGFYDPLSDILIEPDHTGISYSFTADGFFEEAYYRAIPNPVDPSCPEGMLQWQHGSYILQQKTTTSLDTTTNQRVTSTTIHLYLTPIEVDGRQVLSRPCDSDNALYMRYNQSEIFKQFTVSLDEYHNVQRLDLNSWDGTPVQPMYLVYSPPQMLPTTTLNPLNSASPTAGSKVKRGLGNEVPLNWKARLGNKQQQQMVHHINADRLWWVGLGMTAVGGLLYLGPRRLGIQI